MTGNLSYDTADLVAVVPNLKLAQSWLLDGEGTYTRAPLDDEAFSAHTYFMTNPSLSGRGSALKKSKKAPLLDFKKA